MIWGALPRQSICVTMTSGVVCKFKHNCSSCHAMLPHSMCPNNHKYRQQDTSYGHGKWTKREKNFWCHSYRHYRHYYNSISLVMLGFVFCHIQLIASDVTWTLHSEKSAYVSSSYPSLATQVKQSRTQLTPLPLGKSGQIHITNTECIAYQNSISILKGCDHPPYWYGLITIDKLL